METAIWWIRRDLRLSDNQALGEALKQAGQVLPVFILDSYILTSPNCGKKRLPFLLDGLRALDLSLRRRGSYLVLKRGNPLAILGQLSKEIGAAGIFAEADYSPYAQRRDQKVAELLPLHLSPGVTIHPPERLLKLDRNPYTIYTAFNKA